MIHPPFGELAKFCFIVQICFDKAVVRFDADRVLKVQSVCRIHARISYDKNSENFF
jgi:hypothetical protein